MAQISRHHSLLLPLQSNFWFLVGGGGNDCSQNLDCSCWGADSWLQSLPPNSPVIKSWTAAVEVLRYSHPPPKNRCSDYYPLTPQDPTHPHTFQFLNSMIGQAWFLMENSNHFGWFNSVITHILYVLIVQGMGYILHKTIDWDEVICCLPQRQGLELTTIMPLKLSRRNGNAI